MKRRLVRFFKILLCLTAVVIIVAAFFCWRSFAAVEAALAPVRERGEPVSIADLRPAPVADDDNAATYLTPINQEIGQVVNEVYPIAFDEDFSWQTGLTSDHSTKLKTILDAHPHLADPIAKASRCSQLAWPLNYDSAPNDLMEQLLDMDVRAIARFQIARARYLVAIDKPDEATAVCLEELRLIQLQGDTPLLVSWLVNIACRSQILNELNGILQTQTLQPEPHAAIEHELRQSAITDQFKHMLETERAYGIDSFRGFSLPIFPLTPQLENYIEYMSEQIAIGAPLPFESSPQPQVTATGMTELLVPSLENARDAMSRTLATERCVRVLNTIQSRADQQTPVDLSDLDLPVDAILDPYSGEPLLSKSTDEGWIIYSVGQNGQDDEGNIEPDGESNQSLDIGVGPPAA
ncbi:hypothetical protein [Allorhodopirellula heiligendammensis]|uniref:Bacterial type II secretion system protein G n=1 Tax=Allorhodopirellula heiligendammensis TaxID=2714739 RepID=A0A5C6BYH3_9BACT|nr:hypothetical protein [Allorhodopirellula heiligendammensis]TWU16326.1 hypothetical protein Poly21_35310 [Allorhodopirellula heiligendammensis]